MQSIQGAHVLALWCRSGKSATPRHRSRRRRPQQQSQASWHAVSSLPPSPLLKLTVTRLLVLPPELAPHFARACPIIVAWLTHALMHSSYAPVPRWRPTAWHLFFFLQHAHECHECKAWCQCFSTLPAERGVSRPCPPPVFVSRAS
jgi:hypothetical protein